MHVLSKVPAVTQRKPESSCSLFLTCLLCSTVQTGIHSLCVDKLSSWVRHLLLLFLASFWNKPVVTSLELVYNMEYCNKIPYIRWVFGAACAGLTMNCKPLKLYEKSLFCILNMVFHHKPQSGHLPSKLSQLFGVWQINARDASWRKLLPCHVFWIIWRRVFPCDLLLVVYVLLVIWMRDRCVDN